MNCPNCAVPMKQIQIPSRRGKHYFCAGCGLKRSVESKLPSASNTEVYFPPVELAPKAEITESKSKDREETSTVKRRAKEAKRLTELRKLMRDITGRVNDMEIQMSRRIEDMQEILKKLSDTIENE